MINSVNGDDWKRGECAKLCKVCDGLELQLIIFNGLFENIES